MSLILNIDTAIESASIALAVNDQLVGEKINPSQKDQASWLHLAIKELFIEQHKDLHQLEAIAISAGPGSYTGLRVGMATAKGLCYALKIPLIAINTLKMMAFASKEDAEDLICPMIDARRMEVFTAIYDQNLKEILTPVNKIIDADSFRELVENRKVCFSGNGSIKFQQVTRLKNPCFSTIKATASDMISLSQQKFLAAEFEDLAYSTPFYGKDFHSSVKQSL